MKYNMKLNFQLGKIENVNTEAIVFFVFEKEKLSGDLVRVDKKLDGLIANIIKKGYFSGEEKQIHPIYTHAKIKADKIILVGLGEKKKYDEEKLRRVVAQAVTYLRDLSLQKITLVLPEMNLSIIEDIGTIVLMSLYQFHFYKTKDKEKIKQVKEVDFYLPQRKRLRASRRDSSEREEVKVLRRAKIIGEAVNWTRDLINHPSNYLTPKFLAKQAWELASGDIKVKVFGRNELEKMRMGLLLGVAKGSEEEPQLIVLEYIPAAYCRAGRRDHSEVGKGALVLVGKGMTFDSGGISLKRSEKMVGMKMDMAGAATVLGVFKVISQLKPDLRIVGIIPAAENLPSGKALKPEDILPSASGQTVEVVDTDAEGRLILGDALYYAQSYKPAAIIDLATLTGAVLIALGHEAAGLLGNNKKLIDKISKSAEETGERVWPLPLWDDYKEQIKSEIADIKNIGDGRNAGVIAAAAFLQAFVGNYPWAHLDIAGTAFSDKPKPYNPRGASGYGIRLLMKVMEKWKHDLRLCSEKSLRPARRR